MKPKKKATDKNNSYHNPNNHPSGIKIKKSCLKRLPKQKISQMDLAPIDINIVDGDMEAIYVRKSSPKNILINFMNQVN
jgi:hypothetical protein